MLTSFFRGLRMGAAPRARRTCVPLLAFAAVALFGATARRVYRLQELDGVLEGGAA